MLIISYEAGQWQSLSNSISTFPYRMESFKNTVMPVELEKLPILWLWNLTLLQLAQICRQQKEYWRNNNSSSFLGSWDSCYHNTNLIMLGLLQTMDLDCTQNLLLGCCQLLGTFWGFLKRKENNVDHLIWLDDLMVRIF